MRREFRGFNFQPFYYPADNFANYNNNRRFAFWNSHCVVKKCKHVSRGGRAFAEQIPRNEGLLKRIVKGKLQPVFTPLDRICIEIGANRLERIETGSTLCVLKLGSRRCAQYLANTRIN